MRPKLGEFLVEHNLISQNQLEEALQAQVIFGGKIGTILFEMGLVSEKTLAGALNKILRYPCAQPEELDNIPESVIQILSRPLAAKHKAVPLAASGRKLKLAMADPKNHKAIDEIAFRTGYVVLPVLALEMRLALALENYYDIKRTMRYITPAKSLSDELTSLSDPKFDIEESSISPQEVRGSEGFYNSEEPFQSVNKNERTQATVNGDISLEMAAHNLIEVRDRNDVADTLIHYLSPRFSRAALFMVVSNTVTGWRAVKDEKPIDNFERFQISLEEPSILKTAVDSQSYFLGPVPENSSNSKLSSLFGSPKSSSVILIPMVMHGRTVGLIYVDDPEIDHSAAIVELQMLSYKALMAFEILILQNKILRK